MSVVINKIFNANIYADGGSLFGMADEFTPPSLKAKDGDAHEPLGFIGSIPYAAGFEPMDGCKIKWNSLYPNAAAKFSNIYQAVKIQVRFHVESYAGGSRIGQVPGVMYLTVRPKNLPALSHQAKTVSNYETELSCTYYKLEHNGVEIVELDFEANIYKVNGVDLNASERASLGI
jgi:P2 family phage contractile tail tube protein